MLEQSIVSRSPSGQWYPQQQQQQVPVPHPPIPGYNNVAATGHLQMTPQWGLVSNTAATMMVPSGNPNAGTINLGNSGTFSNANFWGTNPGAGQGGAGPGDTPGRNSITGGTLTPQQQLMMQQGMLPSQDQCCATCCGPAGGCCGPQQQCCGQTGSCCGPTGGCCPMPGEPVDPFCCAPPMPGQEPPCYMTIYNCFDWTFLLACLLFVLTVVGFAVIVATKTHDDIFMRFGVRTTTELDAAMRPYIIWMNNTNSSNSGSNNSTSNVTSSDDDASASMDAIATVGGEMVQRVASAAAMAVLSKISTAAASVVGRAFQAVFPTEPSAAVRRYNVSRYNVTHNCTQRRLLGSFGVVCMEDNMHANTFAVQLSSWTNARDTLWFLAMVYSGFTLLYAILVNSQRHPAVDGMGGAGANALPSITPQEQEEFMKMTPQQQQQFVQDYQQRVAAVQQQNPKMGFPRPPGQGCCGSDSGIELYDTPFYEFVRVAWFVSGLTAFVWTCNLFISFWAFSVFYIEHTTGPLHLFWRDYARKMNGSLVMVTIFLAWPLCCFVLELVVWLVGVLPWLVIRSTCKRGIEMYRPALPLSQLPMYIRADMFFMDFQDVKRLGFSRQAWLMLTGSDRPFFEACEDPTVDKDPAMTQLMQMRLQWQQTMMSMVPPWMQQQPGMMTNFSPQQQMMAMMGQQPHGNVDGTNPSNMANSGVARLAPSPGGTPATTATNGAVLPTNSPAATPAEYQSEDINELKTRRRRHQSTHEHHRHADPASSGGGNNSGNAPGMEQTSLGVSNANGVNSLRHHRRHRSRSRSRSKAAFESGAAPPVPPNTDAAVAAAAAAGGNSPGATTRHRRRHSRSREKGAGNGNGGASPVPVPTPAGAGPTPEENAGAEGGDHRHHSPSRSRSKAAAGGGAGGDASPAGVSTPGADTQHRHRRRSHSRSRERPANKGAAATDLSALMEL